MSDQIPDPADLLTAYADGELGPAEAAMVETALAGQPGLQAQLDQIRATQAALRDLPPPPTALRQASRERLLTAVVRNWQRGERRRRWFQTRAFRNTAAAAAVIAAVSALGVGSGFGHGTVIEQLSAYAPAPTTDAEVPPVRVSSIDGPGRVANERIHRGVADERFSVQAAASTKAGRSRDSKPDGRFGGLLHQEQSLADEGLQRQPVTNGLRQDDMAGLAKSDELTIVNQEVADADQEDKLAVTAAKPKRVQPAAETTAGEADVEQGGQGAFMAIGAGGGASGLFGNRSGGAKKRALQMYNLTMEDAKDQAAASPSVAATTPAAAGKVKLEGVSQLSKQRDGRTNAAEESLREVAGRALPQRPAQSPQALANLMAQIAPAPLLDGDAHARLGNLIEAYQLPLTVPLESNLRLDGLGAVPQAAGLTNGQQVLMMANRAGMQVVPANGRLNLNTAPVPLDPTDRLGLDAPAFTAAMGTPPMVVVAEDAQLTFALDADTASFDRARAELARGQLPDPAAIRPEHFINAVPADYPAPAGQEAFTLYAEAGPASFARGPLAQRSALVAVGVVGRAAAADERRSLRLVIAVDASGSMARPGALDRARIALDGLVGRLTPADRVAVVAFGDRGRIVAPATPGGDGAAIAAAIASITPGGATNTAEGLALACQVGREMAVPGTELRVVLVTDGAAIAGPDEATARERIAALKAAGGSLLILGVGERSTDGRALEALAKAGDGQQVFLGSDAEAAQAVDGVLLPARLTVLARDAKAQVTWNPQRVTHARLVGYERRRLDHAAFRDDRVDAGEIPTDTVVTALFDVVLAEGGSGQLGTAAVRYYDTRMEAVREIACPMPGAILGSVASPRLRTLACAAELAEQLRGSWWANVRPTPFRDIAAACAGLPAPADRLATMAIQAEHLRPMPEVSK